jgi:hypothetical protein
MAPGPRPEQDACLRHCQETGAYATRNSSQSEGLGKVLERPELMSCAPMHLLGTYKKPDALAGFCRFTKGPLSRLFVVGGTGFEPVTPTMSR